MDPPECRGHSHDHEHGDDLGLSLRPYIDMNKVSCLNEELRDSGRSILKLHEDRLTDTPSLQSPQGDPELILHIPFTEAVSVQSITIHNSGCHAEWASPRHIRLFVDRTEGLDFETARELPPAQQLELLPPDHMPDAAGTIDYPCRPAGKFSNISSLTIFFVDNYDEAGDGDQGTEITHVGLKGKGHGIRRQAVETVYEAQAMPKDHHVPSGELGARNVL